jgi:hypothetical protein
METLEDYLDSVNPPNDPEWHAERLLSVIALYRNKAYVVKHRGEGAVFYDIHPKKELMSILNMKTVRILMPCARSPKAVKYSALLDIPEINQRFQNFDKVEFTSNEQSVLSIWQGHVFPVFEPEREVDMGLIHLFLEHVLNVICRGEKEVFKIMLAKDAWCFQHPNEHLKWAPVLMGPQGTGKNTYTDMICELWGTKWSRKALRMEQVVGKCAKTAIAWRKAIVVDELPPTKRGQKGFQDIKTRISGEEYTVKDVGESEVDIQNVNNYTFISNNYDAIEMSADDRHFFPLQVSADKLGHLTDYFIPLWQSFTPDMMTHLLNFYLRYNWAKVKGFNPFVPAETQLKKELTDLWKTAPQRFVMNRGLDCIDWGPEGCLSDRELYSKFVEWCAFHRQTNPLTKKPNPLASFMIEIKNFVTRDKDGLNHEIKVPRYYKGELLVA